MDQLFDGYDHSHLSCSATYAGLSAICPKHLCAIRESGSAHDHALFSQRGGSLQSSAERLASAQILSADFA